MVLMRNERACGAREPNVTSGSSSSRKRESGFFVKKSSTASVHVAFTRLDALDGQLAGLADTATALDKEVGLVLTCLRLRLLSSACETSLAFTKDPDRLHVTEVTELITSYEMAVADATAAVRRLRLRPTAA